MEQADALVQPRGSITARAISWAITSLRRQHAPIAVLSRQLGVRWWTLGRAIKTELERRAADPSASSKSARWGSMSTRSEPLRHGDRPRKGPEELTGMVDLSRDKNGKVHARLLDLVPGRSKKAYDHWVTELGDDFCTSIRIAALDTFGGDRSAIDAMLEDTVAVLDAFHIVTLGTTVVDEVRRRVQQYTLGRHGRKGDPLYGIQRLLRARVENLTEGRTRAEKILATFRTCPIPEVTRPGRTLRKWREAFLAYFTIGRANAPKP